MSGKQKAAFDAVCRWALDRFDGPAVFKMVNKEIREKTGRTWTACREAEWDLLLSRYQ
jgi:hypothetical protein